MTARASAASERGDGGVHGGGRAREVEDERAFALARPRRGLDEGDPAEARARAGRRRRSGDRRGSRRARRPRGARDRAAASPDSRRRRGPDPSRRARRPPWGRRRPRGAGGEAGAGATRRRRRVREQEAQLLDDVRGVDVSHDGDREVRRAVVALEVIGEAPAREPRQRGGRAEQGQAIRMPGPQRRRVEPRGDDLGVVLVIAHALERGAPRELDLLLGERRVAQAIREQLEPVLPAPREERRRDPELVATRRRGEPAPGRREVAREPGRAARPRAARDRRREEARHAVRARVLDAQAARPDGAWTATDGTATSDRAGRARGGPRESTTRTTPPVAEVTAAERHGRLRRGGEAPRLRVARAQRTQSRRESGRGVRPAPRRARPPRARGIRRAHEGPRRRPAARAPA